MAYGTSWSTSLADDHQLTALQNREAGILFTEDDLLWYKLKPNPRAKLDFSYGDAFYAQAESQHRVRRRPAGQPGGPGPAVADVYRRYLDVVLDELAVKAVLTFGLTDKYSG